MRLSSSPPSRWKHSTANSVSDAESAARFEKLKAEAEEFAAAHAVSNAEHAAQLQSTQSQQSEQLQQLEAELRRAKAEARANADQLTRSQVRGRCGWRAA